MECASGEAAEASTEEVSYGTSGRFDDGRDVVVDRFDDGSDVFGTLKGDVIVEFSDEIRCGVGVAEAGSEGQRQTTINRMIVLEVVHG